MDPRPARRFTIADGLVLIAAAGVGFALVRFLDDYAPAAQHWGWRLAARTWALALPITITLVILRLADRDAPRRRFRAPGAAACLAASIASLLDCALSADQIVRLLQATLSTPPSVEMDPAMRTSLLRDYWQGLAWQLLSPNPMAVAVAGVWAALALSRRWRPEPSWIDRAGIGLGVLWIASMFAIPVLNLLPR